MCSDRRRRNFYSLGEASSCIYVLILCLAEKKVKNWQRYSKESQGLRKHHTSCECSKVQHFKSVSAITKEDSKVTCKKVRVKNISMGRKYYLLKISLIL